MSVLTGPPEIDGFEFLEPIGSGGFADVYLYEQELPRRTVAVKVLRGDISEPAVAAFLDEANLMAQLSAHPSIVTVHGAGVLPEDQRPYIVMEHCPRGNLGTRFRTEAFSVQEALAVGIQLAGAGETAHRAGVLHRDIKPENVLITSLNRPALTDFGIASRLGTAASGAASGMSVPWSAPEVVDGSWSGPASDVYSLAATVYSLLAGRSPFESPAGPNGVLDYAWRILHDDLPPTGQQEVPASLEGVLATAMSRSPQGRYTSALSFARALQKVERELGLDVTNVDVLDNGFSSSGPASAGLPPGASTPMEVIPPGAQASLPTALASLPTVASPLAAPAPAMAMSGMADADLGFAQDEAPALPERAGAATGFPLGALLADITLVMSPSAEDSLRLDPPSPDAEPLVPEPHPRAEEAPEVEPHPGAGEVQAFADAPTPGAGAPPGFDPGPERRALWPAVLIDLTLLGAVAAAGAVYLLLQ